MAATAADRMVECLFEWGVDTVFGLPGDGINGIMESLRQCQDRIRFVQVRHEETAALMACGYAKLTGRLGVCLATSGPGGIHLLNGLYDAKLDGCATTTQASTGVRPWCVVYSGRDSGARTCTFTSYEQCMMTAGPGTGGSCIQNPWFLWYGSNDPSNSGHGRRASGLRPYHR